MAACLWLALAGCAGAPAATPVPAGAVRIGDDLYMVPLAQDVAGCPAYRQFSATRMVTAAIYYRGRDGGFVLDRNEAACG